MRSPSELRKDPASGHWVIIAAERSKRPDDFRHPFADPRTLAGFCPFCRGNEAKTPAEIAGLRDPGTSPDAPGWRVRVVPNKFPALTRGDAPVRTVRGLFESLEGVGVHEVIIESPDHTPEMADLPADHVRDILWMYRERIRSIEAEPQYEYIQLFKNKGREAGASLSHPHTQIVATPIIPKRVKEEIFNSERFHRRTGHCLLCRTIAEETEAKDRLILANSDFVVVAPFASRFPFELRLFPLRHSPYFSDVGEDELGTLAKILCLVLGKMKAVLDDPAYNLILHQGPRRARALEVRPGIDLIAHWYLEIIPVLTHVAGFEYGTGFYINPVQPEAAARFLRA